MPTRLECNTALKILTQYECLADKLGSKIADTQLRELSLKRQTGTITINDLPGTLQREWPGGVFDSLTLAEVRQLCAYP